MNPIKHDMGEVWAGGICACPEAEMGARERLSLAVSVAERVWGDGAQRERSYSTGASYPDGM